MANSLIHIAAGNIWRHFNSVVYTESGWWEHLLPPGPHTRHSAYMPCILGLCSSSFFCSQHLPVEAPPFSFSQTPHPLASLLRFLNLQQLAPLLRAPQTLSVYISSCTVIVRLTGKWFIYVPFFSEPHRRLTEVKATAFHSDSPEFTSDQLVWPWAFYVTSLNHIIFLD